MAIWTNEEIDHLKENYPAMGDKAFTELLTEHTREACYHKANRMLLVRDGRVQTSRAKWSAKEKSILQEYYPVLGLHVARYLPGRTTNAILVKASRMHLISEK